MGNTSCTLVVRTEEKQIFHCGESVIGRIYLSVNDPNGISCQALNIHLSGMEKAVVHHTSDGHTNDSHHYHHDTQCHGGGLHNNSNRLEDHYERNETNLINLDVPIYTPPASKFSAGQYEFPFQFTLPNHLPSSMYVRSGESYCCIRYELKAYLKKNQLSIRNPLQLLNNTVSSPILPLTIYGHGQNPGYGICDGTMTTTTTNTTGSNQEIIFPSERMNVRTCCCKRMGHMELNARLDNYYLHITPPQYPPKHYTVNFDLTNHSKVDVLEVRLDLMENVKWKSFTLQRSCSKSLVKQFIDGDIVESWKSTIHVPKPFTLMSSTTSHNHVTSTSSTPTLHTNNTHHHHNHTLKVTPTSTATYSPLRPSSHTTSVGDLSKFTFTLPPNALDSYNGKFITVHHYVRLLVKTPNCCTSNPESSVDVFVSHPPLSSSLSTTSTSPSTTLLPSYNDDYAPEASAPPIAENNQTPLVSELGNVHINNNNINDVEEDFVVDAYALPSNWNPDVADIVTLPIATVVSTASSHDNSAV